VARCRAGPAPALPSRRARPRGSSGARGATREAVRGTPSLPIRGCGVAPGRCRTPRRDPHRSRTAGPDRPPAVEAILARGQLAARLIGALLVERGKARLDARMREPCGTIAEGLDCRLDHVGAHEDLRPRDHQAQAFEDEHAMLVVEGGGQTLQCQDGDAIPRRNLQRARDPAEDLDPRALRQLMDAHGLRISGGDRRLEALLRRDLDGRAVDRLERARLHRGISLDNLTRHDNTASGNGQPIAVKQRACGGQKRQQQQPHYAAADESQPAHENSEQGIIEHQRRPPCPSSAARRVMSAMHCE